MEAKKINTIAMTRKIRDEHAKLLMGKSHAERIAFYRERAKKMAKKIPALLSNLAITEGGHLGFSKDQHVRLDNQSVETIVRRIQEKRGTYKKKE
jgi:hypothetical protein